MMSRTDTSNTYHRALLAAVVAINMKDASYSGTWIDLEATSARPQFKLSRTYNSRSLRNGIFGRGWCTDFEVSLRQAGDGQIRVSECGRETELSYNPGQASVQKRPGLPPIYRGEHDSEDKIEKTEFGYTRRKRDGSQQTFLRDGKMVAVIPAAGPSYSLEFESHGRLRHVRVADGSSLTFNYAVMESATTGPLGRYVQYVTTNTGRTLEYAYRDENLIYATDGADLKIHYDYDKFHNLTRVNEVGRGVEMITYDTERDRVIGYEDRNGCRETYSYRPDPSDPENRYTTEAARRCGRNKEERIKYEFIHERTKDSRRFLSRLRIEKNSQVTDVRFDPLTGQKIENPARIPSQNPPRLKITRRP